MCVSRFSIPLDARREDIALDRQLALEAADESRGLRRDRDELRHRPAVLRDDDAFGTDSVEQGQALGLELGGRDRLHGRSLRLVINSVHNFGGPVDQGRIQVAHEMVTFRWRDVHETIVWPEELAPGKPRFPTPPWSERR
jgi:hypothetical protein